MIRLEFPFYATFALAVGPVLFFKGFRHLRVQRLIENTPTARIRSMAMGLVELNGTLHPRSTTTAPFSGRPCAYWEVDISTRTRREAWSVIHRNASGNPFYLRDQTGVALVYPRGAECRFQSGWSADESCHGLNLPSCYADYMREHRTVLGMLGRLSVLRFRERVLQEGQALYVLGSATPRARSVSISEGEAMAATGTEDAAPSRVQTIDAEVSAVVRRGENEPTFIISDHSEVYLRATTGWKAAAMIAGGPILTLIGLFYWLHAIAKHKLPW